MKKIIFLTTILFITALFTGCEESDESYMDNRAVIAAMNESSSIIFATSEGLNTYTLKINVSQVLKSDMVFNLEVDETSTATEDVDFSFSESSITIAAGSFSGSIDVVADFDNSSFDGKLVKINLIAPDGIFSSPLSSIDINIIKSCPLPSELSSSYTAAPTAFGGLSGPTYTANFTRVGTTGLTYAIDSGWGPNFVSWATGDSSYDGQFIYPCELTVNADGTVTVTGESFYTGGSGTYDSCTGIISVNLTQAVFNSPFTVDMTFTP
jgi:hypothetical protein